MAHAVFMSVFELLPTRQWLDVCYVSKHWRKMALSFFRQHNNINLTDLVREEPFALSEWQRVSAALTKVISGKTLKPEYIEHMRARPGGTKTLHLLLATNSVIAPLFQHFTVLRTIDLASEWCKPVPGCVFAPTHTANRLARRRR
jgi:hypothetical protein